MICRGDATTQCNRSLKNDQRGKRRHVSSVQEEWSFSVGSIAQPYKCTYI